MRFFCTIPVYKDYLDSRKAFQSCFGKPPVHGRLETDLALKEGLENVQLEFFRSHVPGTKSVLECCSGGRPSASRLIEPAAFKGAHCDKPVVFQFLIMNFCGSLVVANLELDSSLTVQLLATYKVGQS